MLYQLIVYVPSANAERLKDALFDAGAGRYENYDRCCWQTGGIGQFRPLGGSNPAIGVLGNVETVDEIKIEMICTSDAIKNVLTALKLTHPYEKPAYGISELKTIEDF